MPCTAVIGTGAWGRACARLAHEAGAGPVVIIGRDPERTAATAVPGVAAADPAGLAGADLVLWAVPVQHTRAMAARFAAHIPAGVPVASLAKGLEEGSLLRPSAVLAEALPGRPIGCVSGPSLAAEVERGLPLALVAAGPCAALAAARLHGPRCRVYTSPDLAGVELCGGLKNVIAIAAGLCDGLDLGENARAALVTRGLAEIRRLVRAMGGHEATCAGLAGIGDLMATCASPLSRNRALGLAVARGKRAMDILATSATVAEGAWTSRAAVALAARHQVELPIAAQVAAVLWHDSPVAAALARLLSRAPKDEDA
jgi:glycerol-3-phosphate dehydrogenase (NAD(P)+)